MKKRKFKWSILLRVFLVIGIFCVLVILIYNYFNKNKGGSLPVETTNPTATPEEVKEPNTFLNEVKNDSGYTIKEGWQDAIIKYMDLYVRSLYRLETQDLTSSFTDSSGNEAYLTQMATDLLVKHHLMQTSDMHLASAKYNIDYKSITTTTNTVTIKFLENDYFKFKYLDGIESKAYDIENTIILDKVNDNYSIKSLRKVQDYYIMYTNELDISANNFKTKANDLEKTYLESMKAELDTNNDLLAKANNTPYVASKTCDYKYDRDKALTYAKEYVNKRNKDYTAYDNVGGNCQNFVSQTMFAGGIPMDYKGKYQWKHYSSTLDTSNSATGRTASFVGTTSFYNYVVNNTGYGLCADWDINLFYAEPGDEIQVGYSGYSHATVVVGKVIKDGKVIDLLINCNTVSLEDYPVLAYLYPNKRLIKVLGYNGD